MAKSQIAICLVAASICAGAQAQELWAFARMNAGKFASEISVSPGLVKLRIARPAEYWHGATYDQQRGQLKTDFPHSIREEWVLQRCSKTGEFVGQNAYGASRSVARARCERLSIVDTGEPSFDVETHRCPYYQPHELTSAPPVQPGCEQLRGNWLIVPMSPTQYRDAKTRGLIFEIEFEVGVGARQEVVRRTRIEGSATIADPVQRDIQVLTVSGNVTTVHVLTADGKTRLATATRAQGS